MQHKRVFFSPIKCCIILWGLMQDFVKKKQYFIPFLYSFYKSTPSPHGSFLFRLVFPSSAVLLSFHITLFLCNFLLLPPFYLRPTAAGPFLVAPTTLPPRLQLSYLRGFAILSFIRRVIFSHNSRRSHCVSPYLRALSFRTKRILFNARNLFLTRRAAVDSSCFWKKSRAFGPARPGPMAL